jgi:hypothetical protein
METAVRRRLPASLPAHRPYGRQDPGEKGHDGAGRAETEAAVLARVATGADRSAAARATHPGPAPLSRLVLMGRAHRQVETTPAPSRRTGMPEAWRDVVDARHRRRGRGGHGSSVVSGHGNRYTMKPVTTSRIPCRGESLRHRQRESGAPGLRRSRFPPAPGSLLAADAVPLGPAGDGARALRLLAVIPGDLNGHLVSAGLREPEVTAALRRA